MRAQVYCTLYAQALDIRTLFCNLMRSSIGKCINKMADKFRQLSAYTGDKLLNIILND